MSKGYTRIIPTAEIIHAAWVRYEQARRDHEVEKARQAREASTPTRDIDETRLHISLRNMHAGRG